MPSNPQVQTERLCQCEFSPPGKKPMRARRDVNTSVTNLKVILTFVLEDIGQDQGLCCVFLDFLYVLVIFR